MYLTRKLAAAVLVSGLTLAGCGDDDSTTDVTPAGVEDDGTGTDEKMEEKMDDESDEKMDDKSGDKMEEKMEDESSDTSGG